MVEVARRGDNRRMRVPVTPDRDRVRQARGRTRQFFSLLQGQATCLSHCLPQSGWPGWALHRG